MGRGRRNGRGEEKKESYKQFLVFLTEVKYIEYTYISSSLSNNTT